MHRAAMIILPDCLSRFCFRFMLYMLYTLSSLSFLWLMNGDKGCVAVAAAVNTF